MVRRQIYRIKNRPPIVGVVGAGMKTLDDLARKRVIDKQTVLNEVKAVASMIAKHQMILLTGGGEEGSVPRAAINGVGSASQIEVSKAGPIEAEVDVNTPTKLTIRTDMGDNRNVVNANMADILIAFAGGPGTLSEIGFALLAGRHVICVNAFEFLNCVHKNVHLARDGAAAFDIAYELLGCPSGFKPTGGLPKFEGQNWKTVQEEIEKWMPQWISPKTSPSKTEQ